MIIFIVSLVILVLGLIILGYTLFQKIPDLKNLNIESLAEEKQEKIRKKILEAKFLRFSSSLKTKFNRNSADKNGLLSGKIKQIKTKVLELEKKYQENKDENIKPKTIEELFIEAENFIDEDQSAEAEKSLIEIIAKDNKNIKAYEMLGDLYFYMKNYDQAEEIYKYLLKLKLVGDGNKKVIRGRKMDELEAEVLSTLDIDSKIAVYYEDLGQVYEAMKKDNKALDAYLKATSVDPNNPKYLDKLLEMSIKMKDRGLAKDSFNNLKKINPENAKLADWQEAIEKLS
ncbi:tetratricopeptide repeat protein [Candidatus Falkowbacteria bacterium]|uniref:Tetratricopeptide repeat-like domain-containing protein n=1 Tax=Candidatus Buchananbacteria bacterium CG10_big_fil_rev_8_21_14_0_10_33_19 TaxID=1974525 RepID=A0A2H0W584_9BACT|nr:tetratricopeptide repeat protein [Candidatus Falkowbacteria bacterium]PIS05761.1 MAG: hypothetical protein COT80_03235 [Candidatus Buchananbacteria bacterium CG10_big_fil_rev_8_21_14_0_10_33_19]